MGVRKISNIKSQLQGYSRSLLLLPFDRLVFRRDYVRILPRFRDTISYFPKFKEVASP